MGRTLGFSSTRSLLFQSLSGAVFPLGTWDIRAVDMRSSVARAIIARKLACFIVIPLGTSRLSWASIAIGFVALAMLVTPCNPCCLADCSSLLGKTKWRTDAQL